MVRILSSWRYNLSTTIADGRGNVYRSVAAAATFFLALAADGWTHSLGLNSGGGEVHRQDPLRLRRGFVSRWLIRLGRHGHLLVGELASLLHCLTFDVGLVSMGLRSLPLSKSMLLLRREPHAELIGGVLEYGAQRW
jgi:hypothetical protein